MMVMLFLTCGTDFPPSSARANPGPVRTAPALPVRPDRQAVAADDRCLSKSRRQADGGLSAALRGPQPGGDRRGQEWTTRRPEVLQFVLLDGGEAVRHPHGARRRG